ncbi:MAG: phosphoribosylanthranilate isomerase [Candidatus Bathyarchaeota archaeon]|nr:MAG: phosphoribosylanthranilate isomerase [Candidatus Bathyarchaeota archaeon]
MRSVRVKICGITSEKDLAIAANAGADALGFVVNVLSSPRNISIQRAGEMMRHVPVFTKRVVVSVPSTLNDLKKVFMKLKPDALQIHGKLISEIQEIRTMLPKSRLIGSLQVSRNTLQVDFKSLKQFDGLLLDTNVKGKYGGTGVIHDWEVSKRVRELIDPVPLILAGGLNPSNVKEAIRIVQPYAVDVSSGVETVPGIKDPKKIVEFIENAKVVKLCN